MCLHEQSRWVETQSRRAGTRREADEAKLWRTLDRNPFATNRDLAAAVGNKISERSVSDYLARAKPCFTAKVVQDQEPEELTGEWKTEVRQWLEQVRRIPLDKRIYEDETPIYANEAPRKGRSRKGKPIFRARSRYAKKYTLHMYAKRNSVVHWDLAGKHADAKEIERVAREAVEQMDGGETLIWDRLGRSGRASHPTSQHYSPEAKATFKARGVTTKFLPPKGKYFNPSNSSATISNHITSDRNFCEMVDICRSRKLKGSFESMWRRRHRLRCQASSVPVQMENMQLLTKCCN